MRNQVNLAVAEIRKWVSNKGLPISAAGSVLNKLLKKGYGKPYVYWTEGNALRRTDFAGHTARASVIWQRDSHMRPQSTMDNKNTVMRCVTCQIVGTNHCNLILLVLLSK